MSNVNKTELDDAIKVYRDPYLNQDLFSLNAIKKLECEHGKILVNIEMPYACNGLMGDIKQIIETNNYDGPLPLKKWYLEDNFDNR